VLWAQRPLKDFYELYFTSRGEEYAHIFEAYQNRFGGANGTVCVRSKIPFRKSLSRSGE
jgi:hypothetical protein